MTTYFHGGPPGLLRGEKILPPDVTGIAAVKAFAPAGTDARHVRTDRVFVTTNPGVARIFAALHSSGRGWFYEVLPDPPIEPDPDCFEAGLSWQAPSATIVAVRMLSTSALHRIRRQLEAR